MNSRTLVPRLVTSQVHRAMRIAPVILLEGPRASGKSTVLDMLRDGGVIDSIVDLTSPATRASASEDPTGFVESLTPPTAIDEVQLVPDLALAIKQAVDRNPDWGPTILTGSSPVARGQLGGSDPLVGRAVRLRLRPMTQRELSGKPDSIVNQIADPEVRSFEWQSFTREAYLQMAMTSRFPAARELTVDDARAWIENTYVGGVLPRALDDENRRLDPRILAQVLRSLSATPSAELNVSELARTLQLSRTTATAHVTLLEDLGLIERLPGWRLGASKRHVARPKIQPSDGALTAWAIGGTPNDGETGGLVESMVYRELASQVDNSFADEELFHWRSRGSEVDLLLITGDRFVPIEVKLSRSVPRQATRGIDAFAAEFPDRFIRGLVFYAGDAVVPLGRDRLAVPISALWTTPAD